ncbi:energy-coupled thiamine transporter ThiT [Calorimonas adulescens]|jgi:probable proton-coupled thiamine transporter YuaJ|uniref:Energy-coupled thiamine transporter ThiT n=1 Tax=Calorimonas adulescens TaxID=2606906 RepID=A0A5D8QC91_9THEO|nr:energy-coupled thiamine transporter ThiT [Calorimonas adulescens]TZE82152.1 energy-coupled thiamine transporter ThiT [Calorimonas adulescens]
MLNYLASIFGDFAEIRSATIAVLLILVAAAALFHFYRDRLKFDTRTIVYGGVCIAISFLLSYIRFYHWPQGGSITPGSMLPLFIYAYYFGPVAGITAGAAYGILQLIQDPYILHWAQVLLDYPLPFAALGLAGFFKDNFRLGILVGGFGRFFFHFLSGVIFFGSYAPPGMSPFAYSIAVNGSIIGTEVAICFAISLIPQFYNAVQNLRRSIIRA